MHHIIAFHGGSGSGAALLILGILLIVACARSGKQNSPTDSGK